MLERGTKLGTYEVATLIGAGGMGEVYQAHDSKLDRDVAIKVLPEQFASDSERLARFQREAKLLAALNHPNIAAIYGLEQSGSTHYLVMELVPGETLRERTAGDRPVPVEESLAIARQIAEALEAAHSSEKGIIHRDLKPANVKVTPEGRVKVLDFGLAKAFAADTATDDPTNSPTLSINPTIQGMIMGTAAYMSPEQARGRAVTKATDIFAFGSVLYELLTGKQAFQGEDVPDILAAVVRTEPDWSALPEATPAAIRTLLRRCLRKDRRQRLQDATDARIEIEDALKWIADGGSQAALPAPVTAQRKGLLGNARLAWSAATILLVALALGGFAYFRRAPEQPQAVRFFLFPPEGWSLADLIGAGASPDPLAVSPDGRRIAFVGTSNDRRQILWIRSLDMLTAVALQGTEGAARPFWSPDSRFVGFFADGKLKKVDVSGSPPITLCDAPNDRGGTWNQDGVIVFAPVGSGALQKVSAAGGTPSPATVLPEGEIFHRRPLFLPDGRHFLYYASAGSEESGGIYTVYVAPLDAGERQAVLNTDSQVVYSQGYLLFIRESTLMAQSFDAGRLELTGDAFPIADEIRTTGLSQVGVFSASQNGVLAYQTGASVSGTELTWFDRTGKQMEAIGDRGLYGDVELSPDGTRASVSLLDRAVNRRDIWLVELARGVRTRITSDPASDVVSIWSPDGRTIVFDSNRSGNVDLYQKTAGGVGVEEVTLQAEGSQRSLSWFPDGRYLLYQQINEGGAGNDLWVLPLFGDRKPFPFLQTRFNEYRAKFSPNGRWVAYTSDESGQLEVHVTAFPNPETKWLISTAGGSWSRWRRDGKEIFYLDPDGKLMAAEVDSSGSSFKVGAVRPLFDTRTAPAGYAYDVSSDGQRILINTIPERSSDAPITVVLNWTAGLRN